MSGHSKWNNIKRKKEAADGAKAKIFTRIGREIAVAVKEGGADPSSNSKLRDLISKAKANNVPNDNIDRVIKKAAGDTDKNSYETMVYEGYGPGGVAVIVECLTDNKNRTAGDVRHYFDKFGGNMGTTGCVSFMFTRKGVITMEYDGQDEDKVMEDCFEAGAEDFNIEDEIIEVNAEPNDVYKVSEALTGLGYKVLSAEAAMVPSTYTELTDETHLKFMNLLLENLDENDDVQQVWHNWDMPEEPEED
ncbi:MAG: YebC/PmpR family DNA-binding transcriptional regulator [Oscillospiraceae bacterium]|nr:YebC/PmpR family DNA-binding transcriptional regulator [Oscillospiraceae bacterium]